MHDLLRERVMRRLDSLPEERVYQVLDYIEFVESKYAQRQSSSNVFQKFAENVEDTMRAGKVSAQTIAETMNLMSRAMGVLSGAMAAGKSVASDVVSAARAAQQPPSSAPPAQAPRASDAGTGPAAPASAPAAPSQPAAGVPGEAAPTATSTPESSA